MLKFKEGDRVRIVDRAQTPADVKSGLYYNHYRQLSGTIFKIYGKGESAQVALDVALESLPEDVYLRHIDTRDQMRRNLTGEARRQSAPGAEHAFHLRYVILVAATDLTHKGRGKREEGREDVSTAA
jgi:hypothetical protein